jgi:hypothetical protein
MKPLAIFILASSFALTISASCRAATTECVDLGPTTTFQGTITSMRPEPYSASIPGHWMTVNAPSLSCGSFTMYVWDVRRDGNVGDAEHICRVGSTISATGSLSAPGDDHPNTWDWFPDSAGLPATYGNDFSCQ